MQLINPDDIPKFVENGNYKKQCSVYCCLPLYCYNFVFDLNFYRNSIYYAQTLFCGFKK